MFTKLLMPLLAITSVLAGMEPAAALVSPKSTPQGMKLRELVIAYLQENESKQAGAEPIKDERYFKKEMSLPYRNLVSTPPDLIKKEVMAGPLCLKDNLGILCAAHMVFVINILQNKVLKTINIPAKLDSTDTHRPTPCAVECAKFSGAHEDQILLGELDGRVLIADPETHMVKTFGQVPGRVLGFFVDPSGQNFAVRYESKDEAHKSIPCFAVAASYDAKAGALNVSAKSLAPNLAQSAINKRRSWAPQPGGSGKSKLWSEFAVQTCNHEVKHIAFEEGYCITHCATGTIEKWAIKNIDTTPELVKVAQIEPLKP